MDSWPCLWVLPQLALHRGWPSSQPSVYIRQLKFHKRISILLPIQLSVKAYGSLFNWQHRLAALQVVVSKYNLELMLSNTDQNLGQDKQYLRRTAWKIEWTFAISVSLTYKCPSYIGEIPRGKVLLPPANWMTWTTKLDWLDDLLPWDSNMTSWQREERCRDNQIFCHSGGSRNENHRIGARVYLSAAT